MGSECSPGMTRQARRGSGRVQEEAGRAETGRGLALWARRCGGGAAASLLPGLGELVAVQLGSLGGGGGGSPVPSGRCRALLRAGQRRPGWVSASLRGSHRLSSDGSTAPPSLPYPRWRCLVHGVSPPTLNGARPHKAARRIQSSGQSRGTPNRTRRAVPKAGDGERARARAGQGCARRVTRSLLPPGAS